MMNYNRVYGGKDSGCARGDSRMRIAAVAADAGPNPYVVDINKATLNNTNYRTAMWTGRNLQLTVMDIVPGGDVGLEMHPSVDQFLRIEAGQGLVQMGDRQNNLCFNRQAKADDAIFVPAGTWHNLTNTGSESLKLYTVYAPPNHPWGTVQKTKADAMAEE